MTTIATATKATEYPIVVFYSEEDECYVADIPALKDCSAFGDTHQEAVEEVLVAKELWLRTARENNIPIPQAHPTETVEQLKSIEQRSSLASELDFVGRFVLDSMKASSEFIEAQKQAMEKLAEAQLRASEAMGKISNQRNIHRKVS